MYINTACLVLHDGPGARTRRIMLRCKRTTMRWRMTWPTARRSVENSCARQLALGTCCQCCQAAPRKSRATSFDAHTRQPARVALAPVCWRFRCASRSTTWKARPARQTGASTRQLTSSQDLIVRPHQPSGAPRTSNSLHRAAWPPAPLFQRGGRHGPPAREVDAALAQVLKPMTSNADALVVFRPRRWHRWAHWTRSMTTFVRLLQPESFD
jgi:hypothetical protein